MLLLGCHLLRTFLLAWVRPFPRHWYINSSLYTWRFISEEVRNDVLRLTRCTFYTQLMLHKQVQSRDATLSDALIPRATILHLMFYTNFEHSGCLARELGWISHRLEHCRRTTSWSEDRPTSNRSFLTLPCTRSLETFQRGIFYQDTIDDPTQLHTHVLEIAHHLHHFV